MRGVEMSCFKDSYHIINSFSDWWREHSENYDAVFLDIDGTLISGGHALPGAISVLNNFRKDLFPFCLLTNDGNHSLEEKSEILKICGIDVQPNEIISCSSVLKDIAIQCDYKKSLFFVMGELGKPDFADAAGFIVTRDVDRINECRGVIIGEGTYNWQRNINAVLNFYIMNNTENIMIVPNPDSYWPSATNGEIGIGAGGKARFIQSLLKEYGIAVKPFYLGKPHNPVYKYAFKYLSRKFKMQKRVSGRRILMLGDSILSDIRGANRAGLSSGLLLTGISSENHINTKKKILKPDFIFNSLACSSTSSE